MIGRTPEVEATRRGGVGLQGHPPAGCAVAPDGQVVTACPRPQRVQLATRVRFGATGQHLDDDVSDLPSRNAVDLVERHEELWAEPIVRQWERVLFPSRNPTRPGREDFPAEVLLGIQESCRIGCLDSLAFLVQSRAVARLQIGELLLLTVQLASKLRRLDLDPL